MSVSCQCPVSVGKIVPASGKTMGKIRRNKSVSERRLTQSLLSFGIGADKLAKGQKERREGEDLGRTVRE